MLVPKPVLAAPLVPLPRLCQMALRKGGLPEGSEAASWAGGLLAAYIDQRPPYAIGSTGANLDAADT
jgi:hypothetical protein